ncbi:ergosterol biosynthesis ERG4/ERG24 family protein [Sarocladium implicatum]|nr:ergosterol biosynthesis ERG4/ERG24 family protein [Sarocladium implicatum]
MSTRYSLRQTPKKKQLYEGMVETPVRASSRRQSSFPPEASEAENDSTSATETGPQTRSTRRRTARIATPEVDDMAKPATNGNANGHANGHTNGKSNGHSSGIANGSATKRQVVLGPETVADNTSVKEEPIIDGWRPGLDPKIDYSGEFEFGGSFGTLALMIFFPLLMWYMWIGATYYGGKIPTRSSPDQSWVDFGRHLVDLVYTGAYPSLKIWIWYWSYLVFEGACYCLLPGVWGHGKPLRHDGNKRLDYFCNAYASMYFTFAVLGVMHFTGFFRLYNIIDEFGPLLSVAIFSGYIVAIIAYFSALWRGKQHRMTGYLIYDFFMGAELNPRMFGILDFKMFFEVRMPWFFLLILSLATASRQYEQYGYVSGEVCFLVMAHWLYANACAKGEELILATWDMYYEKWGFMLIFWNLAGVPLSYCHCTIYLANHHPDEYRWNRYALVAFYFAYLFWYWVWDSCNSQKNRFRTSETGKIIYRLTFPQVPWQTVHNPKTITSPAGTILVDGWYGYARKIHYTADIWFSCSWGLITGFSSPFPWFYPLFFCCMIAHRANRDITRCRQKYGDAWLEYERRVPYLFIPYVI